MGEVKFLVMVYLLVFWFLMAIFAHLFPVNLGNVMITTEGYDQVSGETIATEVAAYSPVVRFIESLTKVPVIKNFVPLIRMMSFQYQEDVPWEMTIILQFLAMLTAIILYYMALDTWHGPG